MDISVGSSAGGTSVARPDHQAKKPKKPPACDRCKAKRVLCHPNPAGCPRCVEKGVECTTTPVVRRKPQRKPKNSLASAESNEETSPTATSSAPAPDAVLPVPAATTTTSDLQLNGDVSFAPVASTSQVPYTRPPLAITSEETLSFQPSALAEQLSLYLQGLVDRTAWVDQTLEPALVEHLCDCFRQGGHYDHPLLRGSSLDLNLPRVGWQLWLLSPEQRILAYAVLAIGATLSFSPAIIGTSAKADPTSFEAVDELGEDLREFGKRRKAACEALTKLALEKAKEGEVMLHPSLDNAATCYVLDSLVNIDDGEKWTSRPWLSAYMTHLRAIIDKGEIESPSLTSPHLWALHLSADLFTEVHSGQLTSTLQDQLLLTGPSPVSDKEVADLYKKAMAETGQWPNITPFAMYYINSARKIVDSLLGPYARRQPLDNAAISSVLSALSRLRSLTLLHFQACEPLINYSSKTSLFPHAKNRKNRWTPELAARGLRNWAAFTWTGLVPPIYRELGRRMQEMQENLQRGEASLTDIETRQAYERLEMSFRQVRDLVPDAVEIVLDAVERAPQYVLFVSTRRFSLTGLVEILANGVEQGTLLANERAVALLERSASALKRAGYASSTPQLDALIHRLESHALNLRLAMPPPLPAGQAIAPAGLSDPFAFAYLSEVSPAAGASGTTTPVLPAATTSSNAGAAAASAFDTVGTSLRLEDLLRTPTSDTTALPTPLAPTGPTGLGGVAFGAGDFADGNSGNQGAGVRLDLGATDLGDEMFATWGVW
ncbi:Zn(2)-C6 fungal-type domain-containing protein [Rhodotorula toruloides]|uniref:Zn(2)-C6 fungal-type domain-containing protein n=1 Tax=Rhodotorula toruloides TaxID=5286 RepID=A0A2S9ZWK5_RHOTO|nr:Zn(2)-C6 fungal-type domain-containing protein [Rhodotorula toruloides]PRQ70139.1 hypothetical protein AAT19DRAFT_11371 [Rhodotorula toruloides]